MNTVADPSKGLKCQQFSLEKGGGALSHSSLSIDHFQGQPSLFFCKLLQAAPALCSLTGNQREKGGVRIFKLTQIHFYNESKFLT